MKLKRIAATTIAAVALMACSAGSGAGTGRADAPQERAAAPADSFSADTAYALVVAQTDMGPRTPGSEAGARCAGWIASRLRAAGADTVEMQRGSMRRWDGQLLPVCNVLASFNSGAPRRVLLVAHYDTRPWADMEADPARRMQPIPGANDGASGVAVILEIARCIGRTAPRAGVDVLLVDAEDSGYSEEIEPGLNPGNDTWCLGTQMWAERDPYAGGVKPAYAILLDMVGGAGAQFHREQFSDVAAARVVDKIWAEAAALGYGSTFVNSRGGAVVDDHIYVNRAGIPAADIIENMNPATGTFPPTWHTHDDNAANIDRTTLERVGKTVLSLIYKEK